MGPIEHRVSKPGDWPERVAPLARALSHSFPAWVAAGPYPAVSAPAKPSLLILQQQVLECHPFAIPSEHIEFADPDLQQQLAVMFDSILSISTLVRDIASSPYRVRCARDPWLLFATAVWRSVSRDLSIHCEVGFVKPRQPGNHPLSESDFDGNATLVLSHVVMPVAASSSDDSDMGFASVEIEVDSEKVTASHGTEDDSDKATSDGIEDDSDEATSDGIEDDSDKATSDGLEDDSDKATSDGIEDGSGKATRLTTSDEIEDDSDEATSDGIEDDSDKATSDGIEDEPSSDSSPQAPPIEVPFDAHILAGTGIRYLAELPVFVIVDPDNFKALLSGVVYQRHVWGIDEPAIGLILSAANIGRIVFSWIDTSGANDPPLVHFATAADDLETGTPLGIFDLSKPLDAFAFAQFVFQLRNHHRVIAEASACGCTSFSWRSDLVVEDPLYGEQCQDIIKRWAQAVDQNDDFCGEGNSSPIAPSSSPLAFPPPGPGETATTSKPQSNSSFANQSDSDLGDNSPTSNWLMEHNVFITSRVAVPYDLEMEDSDRKITFYDEITADGWIPGWSNLADLPNGPDHLREKIFNSSKGMQPLSSQLADVMKSHFSYVLLAAQSGDVSDTTGDYYGAIEADCRHVWDDLLLMFTGNLRDSKPVHDVFFERTLNAPRNPTADGLMEHTAIHSSFSQWIEMNATLTISMLSALYRAPYRSNHCPVELGYLRAQLSVAYNQATRMETNLRIRNDRMEDFVETVTKHKAKQPQLGVCDAVFVAVIPDLYKPLAPNMDFAYKKFLEQLPLVQPETLGSSQAQWRDSSYHHREDVATLIKKSKEEPAKEAPTVPKSKAPTIPKSKTLDVPKSKTDQEKFVVPSNGEKQLIRDNFIYYDHSASTRATPTKSPDNPSGRTLNDLLLPILVVEYKKKSHNALYQAVNQCRSYLVSSLCFLDALGLGDEPVFGLVINGNRGIITMGWRNGKEMYSMERNCRSYDLTDPMSVFQFVVILLRLAQRREALITKFEDKRKELKEALELRQGSKYESLAWSKAAQLSGTGATAEIQA